MGIRTILGLEKKETIYLNDSYSQEGEDIILKRIFKDKTNGFFVDVGAYHPMRFSSTYKFYKRGWRGINIDAMPGSMELFKKSRPLDINLEIPVSDCVETIPFYIFNEPALNTCSENFAIENSTIYGYKIEQVIDVETRRLADVLDQHLPKNQKIDFLNVDAEGFEYRILKSNNWDKYCPPMVLVESTLLFPDLLDSDIYGYMQEKGYELFAKLLKTAFFKSISFSG